MDPDATLRDITWTFKSGEWDLCLACCKHMRDWLIGGGFAPGNFDRQDIMGFTAVVAHIARAQLEREMP